MREIPLTKGYVALVDDEDFERLSAFKWYANGNTEANRGVYACRRAKDGRDVWMHREVSGAPPGAPTDHVNRNSLDNRRANLRVCSPHQNMHNRATARTRRGEYRGIFQKRPGSRWKASIRVNGVSHHLGLYDTALAAALAYDAAAVKHHGEFAALNFPPHRQLAPGSVPGGSIHLMIDDE